MTCSDKESLHSPVVFVFIIHAYNSPTPLQSSFNELKCTSPLVTVCSIYRGVPVKTSARTCVFPEIHWKSPSLLLDCTERWMWNCCTGFSSVHINHNCIFLLKSTLHFKRNHLLHLYSPLPFSFYISSLE